MLDLRQLTVLRAVAREGSLAGAARSLHYSQPTVAHHLAALESHLGVDLVSRTPRGATLTDLGSTNGTTVNGNPVHQPWQLNDGDVIRVGHSSLVFRAQ